MDRRFVSFYFNRSGMGEGGDDAATRFVNGQTDNPYAYFAAFKPTGEIVGETEIYADKDSVMAWLVDLLNKHPEFAGQTDKERATLAAGGLTAARLAEDLAHYDDANARYRGLLRGEDAEAATQATLGMLRIARYTGEWDAHTRLETLLRATVAAGRSPQLLVDADVERGYRLLHKKDYTAARALLQETTVRAAASPRLAEAHFSAGRACWFLDDLDWAKFHWGWIVANLPEDRLYMRARIAAAAEGMPYPNVELGDYKPRTGNIGTHNIVTAVNMALEVYRQMLPLYEAKKFTAARPAQVAVASGGGDGEAVVPADGESPLLLVSKLRDGNPHVRANNRIVDKLMVIGEPAVAALKAAIEDRAFPGRGYSAWALTQVLKANSMTDEHAMKVLRKARRDRDPYVAELTRSGLSTLPSK